jgi:hypothetical protein
MQRVIVLSFIDQAAPINSYPEKTASFDAVFFVQMQQNTKRIEKNAYFCQLKLCILMHISIYSKLNCIIISFLAVSYQPSAISSVAPRLIADGQILLPFL